MRKVVFSAIMEINESRPPLGSSLLCVFVVSDSGQAGQRLRKLRGFPVFHSFFYDDDAFDEKRRKLSPSTGTSAQHCGSTNEAADVLFSTAATLK